jgi:hypothetical protein
MPAQNYLAQAIFECDVSLGSVSQSQTSIVAAPQPSSGDCSAPLPETNLIVTRQPALLSLAAKMGKGLMSAGRIIIPDIEKWRAKKATKEAAERAKEAGEEGVTIGHKLCHVADRVDNTMGQNDNYSNRDSGYESNRNKAHGDVWADGQANDGSILGQGLYEEPEPYNNRKDGFSSYGSAEYKGESKVQP